MSIKCKLNALLLLVAFLVLTATAQAGDLLKYAPHDCDMVLSLDVKALVQAPAVRKYAPVLAERYGVLLMQYLAEEVPAIDKLLKDHTAAAEKTLKNRDHVLGMLDGLKDHIHRVVVAGRLNGGDEELILLFDCDMDADKFIQFAGLYGPLSGDRLKVGKPDAAGLIEVRVTGEEESWLVGVVENGVMIATPSKSYAQEAVARAKGKKKAELSKEMQALLKKVDVKQTCWIAAIDTDENLQFRGGISVGNDIRAELITTAKDEEAAKQQFDEMTSDLMELAEFVGGVALLAKEFGPLVDIMREVKPVAQGNDVTIRIVVDAETLGKMIPRK